MEEVWKDAVGFENLYQVSNLGRIKSFAHNREKVLKLSLDKDGYMSTALYKEGKVKRCKVHRVVAEAFIKNPENKKTVNHINGIKVDNTVINLEWNTHKENARHAVDTGLRNKWLKPILQYDLDGNFLREWVSSMAAHRELKITHQNIAAACAGYESTNSAGGFRWKYKHDTSELVLKPLRNRVVIVTDLITMEEIIYSTVRDVSKALSIDYRDLGGVLRGEVKKNKKLIAINKQIRYK